VTDYYHQHCAKRMHQYLVLWGGGDFEVFHAALIAASLLLTTPIAANAAFVIYYYGAL